MNQHTTKPTKPTKHKKLLARLKQMWHRCCAAALNWLCDCLNLTRKELYDKAIRDVRHYYKLWQMECQYVRDLYIRRDVYERALKHACSTGGDLCNYCAQDWTKCGHDFSCSCAYFSFNTGIYHSDTTKEADSKAGDSETWYATPVVLHHDR